MSSRRIAMVVIVMVGRRSGAGLGNRVAVCRDLSEVMMAERSGEVQRERRKRKPRPEPRF